MPVNMFFVYLFVFCLGSLAGVIYGSAFICLPISEFAGQQIGASGVPSLSGCLSFKSYLLLSFPISV